MDPYQLQLDRKSLRLLVQVLFKMGKKERKCLDALNAGKETTKPTTTGSISDWVRGKR